MDYKKIYDNLIESRKCRDLQKNAYYETHHIVPKSMGGSDEPDNLVKLTAREHFIAHWLLYRIYQDNKNAYSFYLLSYGIGDNRKRFSSIAYQEAKEAKSKAVSELNKKIKKGHKKSLDTLKKVSKALKGKPKSEEHRMNISKALKGKSKSEEHKMKIANTNKLIDWKSFPERSKKISESNMGERNGRAKTVQLCDINHNIVKTFSTMKDALEYANEKYSISKTTFYRKVVNETLIENHYWKFSK